jgi:Arc/MetJ family transcription regulator
VRTNIDIDDDLMREALDLTGLPTKRSVVEEALRSLIMLRRQQDVRRLRGRLRWEGDLDSMRRDT